MGAPARQGRGTPPREEPQAKDAQYDGGSVVEDVRELLDILRAARVESFEGCGIRVKFSFMSFASADPKPQQPAKKEASTKQADMVRGALGAVDEALLAQLEGA